MLKAISGSNLTCVLSPGGGGIAGKRSNMNPAVNNMLNPIIRNPIFIIFFSKAEGGMLDEEIQLEIAPEFSVMLRFRHVLFTETELCSLRLGKVSFPFDDRLNHEQKKLLCKTLWRLDRVMFNRNSRYSLPNDIRNFVINPSSEIICDRLVRECILPEYDPELRKLFVSVCRIRMIKHSGTIPLSQATGYPNYTKRKDCIWDKVFDLLRNYRLSQIGHYGVSVSLLEDNGHFAFNCTNQDLLEETKIDISVLGLKGKGNRTNFVFTLIRKTRKHALRLDEFNHRAFIISRNL